MVKKSLQIHEIKLENILPNPNQPRRVFNEESIRELANSIKEYGVIQPIVVHRVDQDLYELVSGERRLRASKLAGKETIPAVLTKLTDQDSAIIAIIENIQREDLNYLEEAQSYRTLMEKHGLTQEQAAKLLGKSQSFIANKTRLLKLPEKVQQQLVQKGLTERHARALLQLPDEALQLEVIEKAAEKGLTVKKTEDLIQKIRSEVMTNNYDEAITKDKKARVKSFINAQIYVNTIKSAFEKVKEMNRSAKYEEVDHQDYVEVRIRIPK